MATAGTGAPIGPTQDETTFASLAHFLQLVTWFIGPLVIYFLKRDSRFVAFHAMQAVLLQVAYTFFVLLSVMVFAVGLIATLPAGSGSTDSPPGILIFFPLMWLLIMGGWVLMLYLSISVGIKAARAHWATYPLLGGWARSIVGA